MRSLDGVETPRATAKENAGNFGVNRLLKRRVWLGRIARSSADRGRIRLSFRWPYQTLGGVVAASVGVVKMKKNNVPWALSRDALGAEKRWNICGLGWTFHPAGETTGLVTTPVHKGGACYISWETPGI